MLYGKTLVQRQLNYLQSFLNALFLALSPHPLFFALLQGFSCQIFIYYDH